MERVGELQVLIVRAVLIKQFTEIGFFQIMSEFIDNPVYILNFEPTSFITRYKIFMSDDNYINNSRTFYERSKLVFKMIKLK